MIEVDGVTCRYGDAGGDGGETTGTDQSGVTAVDDVSLAIPDGEFLVVAGANGSGKTTLVRTFNGLVTPDAGSVAVNGTPVADDLVAARTAVGMVFQDPRDQLVAATVGADVAFGPENLGLAHAEIDRRVDEALAAVNMTGRGTTGSRRSPGASASASRSRGRSRWSRTTSSWTSRSPGSTSRRGGPSSTACGRSAERGRA